MYGVGRKRSHSQSSRSRSRSQSPQHGEGGQAIAMATNPSTGASAASSAPAIATAPRLPPPSDADEALEPFLLRPADAAACAAAAAEWKSTCLTALSYGTDFNLPRGSTATAKGGNKGAGRGAGRGGLGRPTLKLKIRAAKTLQFFLDSFHRFDEKGKTKGAAAEGGDALTSMGAAAIDPRAVLADALWIAGCVLQPPDRKRKSTGKASSKSSGSAGAKTKGGKSQEGSDADDDEKDADDDGHDDDDEEVDEMDRRERLSALTYLVRGLAGLNVDPPPMNKPFNQHTLSPTLLQTVLEPNLLGACQLIASEDYMLKRYRKFQTNVFYRQRRFNLLAEESEGFGKLLSLLLSLPLVASEASKVATTGTCEGKDDTDTQVAEVLARIRELVGAFDLDPNRTLDIILDAMEAEVNRACNSASSGIHLGGSGAGRPSPPTAPFLMNQSLRILLCVLKTEFKLSSVPHLLGFKLLPYLGAKEIPGSNGSVASASPSPPTSLYRMCAFLAAHGVLNLDDLMPHLSRPPSDLTSIVEFNKKKAQRVAEGLSEVGQISLNATAAAATSGGKTPTGGDSSAAPSPEKGGNNMASTGISTDPSLFAQANPRLNLIEALVSFGAWHLAAPMLADLRDVGVDATFVSPSLGSAICDLLHATIEPVYASPASAEDPPPARQLSVLMNSSPIGSGSVGSGGRGGGGGASALILRKKILAKLRSSPGYRTRARMTLVPRSAVLPPVRDINKLVETVYGPIRAIGVSASVIGRDPVLYCKLCRLFRRLFRVANEDGKETIANVVSGKTLQLVQDFLVPSVSMFPSNAAICSELWRCIEFLPYPIRYGLYDAWRGPSLERRAISQKAKSGLGYNLVDKSFDRVEAEIRTGIECRYVLKRLSKENVRDMGKRLAKAAHSNPIVVFTNILAQIESYDNLISLMVDSFKFLTNLALDVLGHCILDSLGGGRGGDRGRTKLKTGGLHSSQWLASIEQFAGAFWKKFPEVEIRGVLYFLMRRLQEGHILELGVLRTLLTTAGGLDLVEGGTGSLSKAQLEGRAGGLHLRRETTSFGIVDKVNRKSSTRLREVLQEANIGMPLIVLIAQIRQKVLYSTKTKHIKLIGNLYDSCNTVLSLLLEFLSSPRDWEDSESAQEVMLRYASAMPKLKELISLYAMNTSTAWTLGRPLVRAAMISEDAIREKLEQEAAEGMEVESDMKQLSEQVCIAVPKLLQPWLPTSKAMIETYGEMLPDSGWKYFSPSLFETFWSLDLYDVYCPRTRYESEVTRLKKEAERLLELQQAEARIRRAPSEPSGFTKLQEQELDRIKKQIEQLQAEQKVQAEHCRGIRHKIEQKKDEFFSKLNAADVFAKSSQAFLTYCVFPRCLTSPEDAMFSSRFVQMLHNIDTPQFYTLQFIDRLVKAAAGTLFCVTEDEAGNLGILLFDIWNALSGWRYSGKYEKDVKRKQGSIMNVVNEPTSFESFVEAYNTLHATLGDALVGCLESDVYIHTRAALLVLNRIVRVYPTQPRFGDKILESLKRLQSDDSRPDLKAMANAYSSQIIKARDEGCWKEQDASEAQERRKAEQAKLEERKLKAQQALKEMAEDNQRFDREHGDPRSRGRGDHRRGDRPGFGATRPALNPTASSFTPSSNADGREQAHDRGENRGRDHWDRDHRDRDGRRQQTQDSRDRGDRRSADRAGETTNTRGGDRRGDSRSGDPRDSHVRPSTGHGIESRDRGGQEGTSTWPSARGGSNVAAPPSGGGDNSEGLVGRWQRGGGPPGIGGSGGARGGDGGVPHKVRSPPDERDISKRGRSPPAERSGGHTGDSRDRGEPPTKKHRSYPERGAVGANVDDAGSSRSHSAPGRPASGGGGGSTPWQPPGGSGTRKYGSGRRSGGGGGGRR